MDECEALTINSKRKKRIQDLEIKGLRNISVVKRRKRIRGGR